MTSNSFAHYRLWQNYGMALLGNELSNAIGNNDPEKDLYRHQLKFMHMYEDFICRWTLESYQADEDDYTLNTLKPSEAQCLAQVSNKFLGTSFCVDFYLT